MLSFSAEMVLDEMSHPAMSLDVSKLDMFQSVSTVGVPQHRSDTVESIVKPSTLFLFLNV